MSQASVKDRSVRRETQEVVPSKLEQPDLTLWQEHRAHRIRLGGHITYRNEDGIRVIEDRNGIRPFPDGSELPPAPQSAELRIRELAWMNRVRPNRDGIDVWCEAVSSLAGDDIQSDEVEQLILELGKAKLVDGIELTKLHSAYLDERDG